MAQTTNKRQEARTGQVVTPPRHRARQKLECCRKIYIISLVNRRLFCLLIIKKNESPGEEHQTIQNGRKARSVSRVLTPRLGPEPPGYEKKERRGEGSPLTVPRRWSISSPDHISITSQNAGVTHGDLRCSLELSCGRLYTDCSTLCSVNCCEQCCGPPRLTSTHSGSILGINSN